MAKASKPPASPSKRDRFAEFEQHLALIDQALADDPSPSETSALLRERRMTLNAIESLVIVAEDTAADEVKAKREARRRSVAASAARAT